MRGDEPPPRVLVVEDEVLLALSVEGMLTDWGLQVIGTATSGMQAVAMAEALRPDVVVLDVNLADDVDGVTAARAIVRSVPAAVVFMTAVSRERLAPFLAELGAAAVFKPFLPQALHDALVEVLGKR